jgi:tetratricopeptide (TPR) repeat protein
MNANFAELVYEQQSGFDPKTDAEEHFSRVLELSTESATVYTTYGKFLEDRDDLLDYLHQALDYYRKAFDIDPRDVAAFRGCARLLDRTTDHIDEQIERIEKAKRKIEDKCKIEEESDVQEMKTKYRELDENLNRLRIRREKLDQKQQDVKSCTTILQELPEDEAELAENLHVLAIAVTNNQQQIKKPNDLFSSADTENETD